MNRLSFGLLCDFQRMYYYTLIALNTDCVVSYEQTVRYGSAANLR